MRSNWLTKDFFFRNPLIFEDLELGRRDADGTLTPGRAGLSEATHTKLVNHARAVVKASGDRLPSCAAESFHRKTRALIPAEIEELRQQPGRCPQGTLYLRRARLPVCLCESACAITKGVAGIERTS